MEKKKYLTPQVAVYAIDLSDSLCTPGSIPVGGSVGELDAPAQRRSSGWEDYEK